MSIIQFFIAIIGLIISIRSKSRFSNIGIIFFSLSIVHFFYMLFVIYVVSPHIFNLLIEKVINEEIFARYNFLISIPGELLGVASMITIIVGILKFRD
jgi:presenilin-like A22 family membrane protease